MRAFPCRVLDTGDGGDTRRALPDALGWLALEDDLPLHVDAKGSDPTSGGGYRAE